MCYLVLHVHSKFIDREGNNKHKHSRARDFFKGPVESLRANVFSWIGSYLEFYIILYTTLYA